MTAQEAIQNALSSVTIAVQQSDKDYPDDNLGLCSTLPTAELVQFGFTIEVVDDDADALPRLLVGSSKGWLEVERCPFAPLALLSGDGVWDGAEVVDILRRSGIIALGLDDFAGLPEWNGLPTLLWLFPERLSETLSLLDSLREDAQP